MLATAITGSLALSGGPSFADSPPAATATCPTANVCSQTATALAPVQGLALDGQGNIYVTTHASGGGLLRLPAAGGTATLIASGLGDTPYGVALDGKGFAYVAVAGNGGQLLKVPLAGGTATVTATGLGAARRMVPDGHGHAYGTDSNGGNLLKVGLQTGTSSAFASGPGSPFGVAADTHGDFNVSDVSSNRQFPKVPPAGGGSPAVIASGLGGPDGEPLDVALDGGGYAYLPTYADHKLLRESLAARSTTVAATGLETPTAVWGAEAEEEGEEEPVRSPAGPAAPVIDLPPEDGMTNATPVFSGTAAEDVTVIGYDEYGQQVGTATPGGDGVWSFTKDSPWTVGSHTVKVVARDSTGHSAPVAVSFTAKTGPRTPSITTPISDGTTTNMPVFNGKAPGATTVTAFDENGQLVGTATPHATTGFYSITRPVYWTAGRHVIRVVATNSDGATNFATLGFSVRTGPVSASIITPVDDSNTDCTPVFTGYAPGATTVNAFDENGELVGTATPDSADLYTITKSAPWSPGLHQIVVDAVNDTGATSSSVTTFTVE